jgi:hypothetical protein
MQPRETRRYLTTGALIQSARAGSVPGNGSKSSPERRVLTSRKARWLA